MARYLWNKYKGIYRVIAEYDLSTNDFPRDYEGNVDSSFDDLYIPCKSKIKIKHAIGNVLSCYVPTKGVGMNVLRQIYKDKLSDNLPAEKDSYLTNLCKELVAKNVLESAEVLDGEVYFTFKSAMMDYMATVLKPKTAGASISPFSVKNLPKEPYKIPDKDLTKYKKAIANIPKIDMGGKMVTSGLIIREINKAFDDVLKEKFDIDPNADRKSKCIKGKEYIHSLGVWEDYCKFIKEYNYEN